MAFDNSGNFSRDTSGVPYVSGTTIKSAEVNAEAENFKNGLTECVTKSGKSTPTADLPMGGFHHLNVGAATQVNQYMQVNQGFGGFCWCGTSTGTNAIVVSNPFNISAYSAGQLFRFKAGGTNTTTSVTFQLNALAAITITKANGAVLNVGDIVANTVYEVCITSPTTAIINSASVYGTVTTGGLISRDAYSASTTYTTPLGGGSGVILLVHVVGSGGGGAGAVGAANMSAGGGGGGAGGYAFKKILNPAATYSITIGVQGGGGDGGNPGGSGGQCSFGGIVTAGGGGGGSISAIGGSSTARAWNNGGFAGGFIAGDYGELGGHGQSATTVIATGIVTESRAGDGGASWMGGGGRGGYGLAAARIAGTAAVTHGAGGGGGGSGDATNVLGGNGQVGIVIVEAYYAGVSVARG